MLIGQRKTYEIILQAPSSRVNCYITGPQGDASQDHEYDYPHPEDADGASLTRTSPTRYRFTTPRMLTVGYYDVEQLTDEGPKYIDALRVDPLLSGQLLDDVLHPPMTQPLEIGMQLEQSLEFAL